jgi:hypothetical protein
MDAPQSTDLTAFAENYNMGGAVPQPPPKASKGNSFDFGSIVVQSDEDFARLPDSQKQLLRNMKQGIQYTPQAAAEFVETFNTRLLEQSTPQAKTQAQKSQLDIQKAELDLKKSQADIAQIESRKQAAATEIAGMRSMLSELKGHEGMSASVGLKGSEYLFGINKEPISGTKAADFYTMLEQVQGGTFMQAFNNLKGAGQITEQEGAKATAAIARLNPRQSEEGFNKALMDFDGILAQAQARLQPASQQAAPAQPQQPVIRVIRGQTFVQQPNGKFIPQ